MYPVTAQRRRPASRFVRGTPGALAYAEAVSRRMDEAGPGGQWDGADVRVWEAENDEMFGLTVGRMVARLVNGECVPAEE